VAGTLWPQDRQVTITVSGGAPLPNFVGGQLSAAQAAAGQGGYQINPVTDTTSTQPAGTITYQSPAPGTPISKGEVVTVHFANGPAPVPVPDVRGMNVGDATQVLEQAGFQVASNGLSSDSIVTTESPMGQAPKGSTITLGGIGP
jgi:serine/threonine-protein kinase